MLQFEKQKEKKRAPLQERVTRVIGVHNSIITVVLAIEYKYHLSVYKLWYMDYVFVFTVLYYMTYTIVQNHSTTL